LSARRTLPLIRAASLVPFVRFLDGLGAPTARFLTDAELAYYPYDQPEAPIAFLSVLRFSMQAAESCGVLDLGCRAAEQASLNQLGIFGRAVSHAPDVRSALLRAGSLMRHFSSHESLFLLADEAEPTITVHFTRMAGLGERHVAEQYTAMLVRRVVEASGLIGPCFRRVAFSSDPFGSFELLRHWFCDEIVLAERPGLKMTLLPGILDRPLFAQDPDQPRPAGWLPLGPSLSLRESLSLLVSTMLLGGLPSIAEVADVSGMSLRSLQRQMHAEGTSFREVLDGQRRELALRYVRQSSVSLSGLSQNLGYGYQSSLTRAVKRWTAESPRSLRRTELAGDEALS
jgi:AraC-like DNA-binding protein